MKHVIITGASGNLGAAVVDRFQEDGYHVEGTVSPRETSRSVGKNGQLTPVDLTDEVASRNFVQSIIDQHKTIDVAVLTAGGFAMGTVADTRASAIKEQYALNFETAYNIAQPVFRHMLEQGHGRIFFIGSRPGSSMEKSKGMVAYGLAKSLIFRLAELMNEEGRERQVVTSVVVPSIIDTPPNRRSMPDADFTSWVTPAAIADVIAFYCSDAAVGLREPVIKVYNNA